MKRYVRKVISLISLNLRDCHSDLTHS